MAVELLTGRPGDPEFDQQVRQRMAELVEAMLNPFNLNLQITDTWSVVFEDHDQQARLVTIRYLQNRPRTDR